MSYMHDTAQHRADSAAVEQRRVFAGTVVDAATLPALERANQRLRRRRVAVDVALGGWAAVLVLVLVLVLLATVGMS